MAISDFAWGIAFICAFIGGILGLVFYKSFKIWFLKILFSYNPLGLPQQSDFQINFVFKGNMIIMIIWGALGILGLLNDYIFK